MDDDNSGTLDMREFKKACADFRFGLTETEIEVAFKAFDQSGDGLIDYEEFISKIRVMNSYLLIIETNEYKEKKSCKPGFWKIR